MSGAHFSAFDATAYLRPGFIGSLVDADHLNQIDTIINADPQATKTYTVVVTADANSQVHTYTVDNVAVRYTSDASGTKAEIIAGLLAAHNANGYARGRFTIASDGVDTLTLTGISPAVDSVVADSDSNLVTTLTRAAAAANTVAFGVACIRNGSSNDHYGDTGSVAYAAKFTAMVQTLTIAYTSGAVYRVDIEWRGRTYSASTIGATDLAATNAALLANINTAMAVAGTYNVTATSGASTTITLTSDIPGEGFGCSVSCTTAASLTLARTTVPVLSDINQCFAGISIASNDTEITTVAGDSAVYAANSGVSVLRKGRIRVYSSESPTPADSVFVKTTAGTDAGKFTKTQGSDTIFLPFARWALPAADDTSNSLAIVELF